MTNKTCTIALDIGTTSLKAVAYLADASQLSSRSMLVETDRDGNGKAIQDPKAIYESVMKALAEVCEDTRKKGYRIAAIGFSAAMHSLIPIASDNTPLFPAMTWLDARSHEEAQALWSNELGKDIYEHTGTPIHAMAPVTKIAWFRKHHPAAFEQTRRYASIKEYVWFRWFGEWEIDEAMASATGLYELSTGDWYEPALSYAGIRADQLSKPVATNYTRTNPTEKRFAEMGIEPSVPFCIGASDGVLASLAANAIERDTMVLTIGTSLALRTGFHQPTTDADTRYFCYVVDSDHYIVGGPSNSGGVVLDWLYRNVFTESGEDFERRFPALCEVAGRVDVGNLMCIPYVSGERAPLWDESATASFVGLHAEHEQAHLMRAAIEGILFNAYWIAQRLMKQLGEPKKIIASGKLFQQAWVRQFTADLFGIDIYGQEEVDGATLGAVMMANAAAGLEPIRSADTRDDITHPNVTEQQYLLKKFSRYQTLCQKLLDADPETF
ncbi:gluconokinase [Alicyclobacillus dauci]|uniref:Gluconokinase n=1 Tax=Alicyclobacillus dauci TaxID=1475485 RepID=A0ABY6Z2S5_9BACL|nr:gluconokinase [Alicyclobacillus dauci]WAH36913.1 gluconokinase [Alicyclobacillus dauci]